MPEQPVVSAKPRYGVVSQRPIHVSRVAYVIARRVGCTPKTADSLVRTVNERCAGIVRSFRELGDDARLARFLAPIKAAEAGLVTPALTDTLEADSVQAAHEVVEAVVRLRQRQHDASARKLLRREIARAIAELTELDAALGVRA